jgi:serine/threonine protein kinase/dienelactone hydrolase
MIGKTITHYKIIEKLGEGGMGIVYKAEDTKLNRLVALKFLPRDLTRDQDIKKRFVHEAQAASALEHTNICSIHEINETAEGQLFICMGYYEGDTVEAKTKQGPLEVEEALDIAIQIAQGLDKAHKQKIVHRDIKSANIIITNEDVVKIVDFGIAKLAGQTRVTKDGSSVGTVSYMSPEQTLGKDVDHRADIWSLGIVMYEMLTGLTPFERDYEQAVVYSIINEEPQPIIQINPAIPTEMEQIVNKALQKNPDSRYPSAADMLNALKDYRDSLQFDEMKAFNLQTIFRLIRKPKVAIPGVLLIFVVSLLANWFFNRQTKIHWAREDALPEIRRLVESNWSDFTDAYKLAEKAEHYIPNDPELVELFSKSSLKIQVSTEPQGSNIYIKNYQAPDTEWEYLGVSPIKNIRLPIGIIRWKIEKDGYETVLAASSTWDITKGNTTFLDPNDFTRVMDEIGNILPGMVRVKGAETSVGYIDDFFIDRYEVTNSQYKEFIDGGGYRKKEYWKHKFIKDKRILTWEAAMAEFVDQTGRPGPAAWRAGDYESDQGNFPVSGISWFEAAAYAEFVGKRLPTEHHWGLARGESTPLIKYPQLGGYAVFAPFSNFNGKGPVPVGSLPGVTSYGAYDMAGNVREWCWNETSKGRLLRGGAWDDNTYMFRQVSQAPPFDRSAKNGFRCSFYLNPENIPSSAFGVANVSEAKDYSTEQPVSDHIFQVYKEQFSYDETDLNTIIESRDESSEDWIHEKISYDASYSNERIIAHLFLPKNVDPQYQTVIYFPGSGAIFQNSSDKIEDYFEFPVFLSFLLKNGRAVLFPVYHGTFERRMDTSVPILHQGDTHLFSESTIKWVKDFKRSIDYLETRDDIDSNELGFYGMSWGASLGGIIPAVDDRLAASVLVAGGFRARGRPEVNQINYVSRVTTPTLMLNGMYDTVFPSETTVKPFLDFIGTPAEHKKLILYETDHVPPRNEIIKETLTWFDIYLGPVR